MTHGAVCQLLNSHQDSQPCGGFGAFDGRTNSKNIWEPRCVAPKKEARVADHEKLMPFHTKPVGLLMGYLVIGNCSMGIELPV